MELISTYICKNSDLGIHGNMFGGKMLAFIDESAGAYAAQLCDSHRMVTIKIEELVFKSPVRLGNLFKIYGKVDRFGNTSITLYIEVRKHNVHTGLQDVVTHTKITFVKIDEDGTPIPISERVKVRYNERVKKYNKGLLTPEELEKDTKKFL
jgi:acyl-CoA thioesterase YciA